MTGLPGTPSDRIPEVLATGRCVVSHLFFSLSARDPEGRDAEYLRWHTFDHRPEQYRLESIRGSLRLVSTPECRAARAVSDPRYDAVDHVMTYFFSDLSGLKRFYDLGAALGRAGRIPFLLPAVDRALFRLDGMAAASRIKVGADVLPWWPLTGTYLLIEQGAAPGWDLVNVPGVAGCWWGAGFQRDPSFSTADGRPLSTSEGLHITCCFLDDHPVETASRLEQVLDKRHADHDVLPLLAAPFYTVSGDDYDRHLP